MATSHGICYRQPHRGPIYPIGAHLKRVIGGFSNGYGRAF
jgi:hypothetical protein